MLGQALRNFAIDLLDDEHGINSAAWNTLDDMLYDNNDNDILAAVKSDDGRWYLPADVATELRAVVKVEEDEMQGWNPDDEDVS